MKTLVKPLLFLLLALPAAAIASPGKNIAGRETNNGGDPVALEFTTSALEAIQNVRRQNSKYPELQLVDLAATLSGAQVLVVDEPLTVEKDGVVTHPAATNSKDPARIKIARASWKEIYEPRARQALALHELLGLLGLEETGVYKIVQRYRIGASAPVHFPRNYEAWKFRAPTEAEQKFYASVFPTIKGYVPARAIDTISGTEVLVPLRDKEDNFQLKEMSVRVLHYELDYDDGDEDEDFYQLVVSDVHGKIFSSDVIFEHSNFQVQPYAMYPGAEELEITWLANDDKGNPATFHRSLRKDSEWHQNFGFDGPTAILKDSVPVQRDGLGYIVLGKPSRGNRPYGLYEVWGFEHRLIKAFTNRIPGYENSKNGAGQPSEPAYITSSILSVYQNDRGVFALVNDLNGIISVNVKTSETKAVYEIPEEGRFGYALKVRALPNRSCTEITLGIYGQEQGPAFYSQVSSGNPEGVMYPGLDTRPYYQLHLGVVADKELFHVDAAGCPRPQKRR